MRLFGIADTVTIPTPPTALIIVVVLGLGPLIGWALAQENWLLLVLLGGVALLPVVIRWPVVSTLGLYAFLLPFDSVAGLAGGATLTRLIGMATGGVLALTGLAERRLTRPPVAALFWGALVLWGVITVAWALDPEVVPQRSKTAVSLFLLYLAAVSFKVSRKELSVVCTLTVAGAVVAALAASMLGVEDPEATTRTSVSLGDQSANPNVFGSTLVVPFALAVGAFIVAGRRHVKLAALAAMGVLGAGIFFTGSRGVLLALGILCAVLVYRVGVRWHIFLMAVVLVALLGSMPAAFFSRVMSPFTGEDATGAGRTEIWKTGLASLDEFWLLGAGAGNFREVYGRQHPMPPGENPKVAHNIYLQTWVELGVVGLVFLLTAIATHLWAAWRLPRGRPGHALLYAVEAGCIALLVCSFFGDRMWSKAFWMGWILLAWATRLAREDERADRLEAEAPSAASPA